ncbi:uncharacterized protein [Apostichopus japonicus]|uniref:uncharacterized protein isoform X2 n=1 Tax=Stichopus japonicus TaxID=307972 RepID=UPI003AB1AD36
MPSILDRCLSIDVKDHWTNKGDADLENIDVDYKNDSMMSSSFQKRLDKLQSGKHVAKKENGTDNRDEDLGNVDVLHANVLKMPLSFQRRLDMSQSDEHVAKEDNAKGHGDKDLGNVDHENVPTMPLSFQIRRDMSQPNTDVAKADHEKEMDQKNSVQSNSESTAQVSQKQTEEQQECTTDNLQEKTPNQNLSYDKYQSSKDVCSVEYVDDPVGCTTQVANQHHELNHDPHLQENSPRLHSSWDKHSPTVDDATARLSMMAINTPESNGQSFLKIVPSQFASRQQIRNFNSMFS